MERNAYGTMFAMRAQDSIRWLFFNVGLALFPIWSAYIVMLVSADAPAWQRLLKDGELFVFASTLSAAAMGTAFLERDVRLMGIMIASCGLILVLIVSGGLFYITLQSRLTGAPVRSEQMLARISVYCATFAIVLSYLVPSSESVR